MRNSKSARRVSLRRHPIEKRQLGTGAIPDTRFTSLVRENFKLTPKGIIDTLKLRRPIYRKTAAFGHFGRSEDTFSWEATDKVEALKEQASAAHAGAK